MRIRDMWKHLTKRERLEALGPDNLWFAGTVLKHPPTPGEAIRHYFLNRKAEEPVVKIPFHVFFVRAA